MLRVEQLRPHGLAPVTFSLEKGECLAVRGPSGSGKTVLLRAIADLDPVEGDVYWDGVSRLAMSGPEWRKKVRFVAAEPGWWAETAVDHFPQPERARAYMTRLGLAPELLDQPVQRLSTGERQRLGLVRSLCDRPPVLLLDEPTAALDAEAEAQVETLIRQELEHGTVVMLVTHSDAQAARLAHKRLRIGQGRAEMEAA